jgi:hypothetical protein
MESWDWRRDRSEGGQEGSLWTGMLLRQAVRRERSAELKRGQQSEPSRVSCRVSMCSVQAAEGSVAMHRRTCVESSGASQKGHLLSSWIRQSWAVTPNPPLFSEPCLVHQRCFPAGRAFIKAAVASQSTKVAAAGSSRGVGCR